MNTIKLIVFLLFFSGLVNAQNWSYSQLSALPILNSNNAVTSIKIGSNNYVYSFSGIGFEKTFDAIHHRTFKLDVENNTWSELMELPNGGPRIAANASLVKDMIYVMGGYRVLANGNEESLDEVHRFDPSVDSFIADGNPIPVPIDDHVQAVWRDSLIYIVTGWSDFLNVPAVQIYNPATDQWMEGTAVPNNSQYTVFGAAGTIVGDTLYYIGGAANGSNFPLSASFRKGAINPNNPTEINWSRTYSFPARTYRMAAGNTDDKVFWVGGGSESYNYDGIAYADQSIVEPKQLALVYNIQNGSLLEYNSGIPKIMDLRSCAKIADNKWIIAGGMVENAQVVDSVFMINFNDNSAVVLEEIKQIKIFPNPTSANITIQSELRIKHLEIVDIKGNRIFMQENIHENTINRELEKGVFIFNMLLDNGQTISKKVISIGDE